MLPSTWPEMQVYPALRKLLASQVDMQFADLHALLRLPVDSVAPNVGGNLITASHLFNLIAGASVLFYDSSVAALISRGDRGRRFKDTLETYYPWTPHDLPPAEAARALWDWARSPVAHTLGVGKERRVFPGAPEVDGQPVAVRFSKWPLTADQVRHLASTREPDPALWPTASLSENILTVDVVTLAWGVHEMYRRLFGDTAQASAAENTAAELLRSPRAADGLARPVDDLQRVRGREDGTNSSTWRRNQ